LRIIQQIVDITALIKSQSRLSMTLPRQDVYISIAIEINRIGARHHLRGGGLHDDDAGF